LAHLDCSREALAGVLRPGNAGANRTWPWANALAAAFARLAALPPPAR
jgi:hypothetical protein